MPTEPTRLLCASDLHLTTSPLYGTVDTWARLDLLIEHVRQARLRINGVVLAGDLTDTGEAEAYRRLRELSSRFGVPVSYGMGNHDVRRPFRRELLDLDGEDPVDYTTQIRGVRIVHLDTSVPGAGHGEVTPTQREWLADVLSTPAPEGSVLVMHHPPLATSSAIMTTYRLRERESLTEIIAPSDVRVICSGHLHAAGSGTFAGKPVSVSGAISYASNPLAMPAYRGMRAGSSANLVEIGDEVVTSIVPLEMADELYELGST